MRPHRTAPFLLAAALVASLALAGCVQTTERPPAGDVPFETLVKGNDSSLHERQEHVVRDQASWEELWAEHTSRWDDAPPAPDVDFDTRMVLAVFHGIAPSGCHSLELAKVLAPEGEDRLVVVGAYVEATGGGCTDALVFPYEIITVPRYDVPVDFVLEEVQRPVGDGGTDDDDDGTPGDNGTSDGNDTSTDDATVPFDTLERGQSSGVHERRTVVVRNESAWAALWDEHGQDHSPPPERPAVDFDATVVVAIFKGDSPGGCDGAEIVDITRDDRNGTLVVHGEWYVLEGSACTLAITQPFHIVTVAATDDEVDFDMRETTRQA